MVSVVKETVKFKYPFILIMKLAGNTLYFTLYYYLRHFMPYFLSLSEYF